MSGSTYADRIAERKLAVLELAEAFDKRISDERLAIFADHLLRIPMTTLRQAIHKIIDDDEKFPSSVHRIKEAARQVEPPEQPALEAGDGMSLEEWLAADPRNREAWDRMKAMLAAKPKWAEQQEEQSDDEAAASGQPGGAS